MKNLILSLLGLLIINCTFAQNGGQQNYNSAIKIEQSGSSVKVTNLKDCESVVVVHFNTDVTVTIPALQFVLVPIPTGFANTIKAQLKDGCSNDHGQVELLIVTPLKFLNFKLDRISDTECYVNFETAEVDNVKEIYIKISLDGKIFTVAKTLKPNQTVYHEYLDLTPYLPKKK